MRGAVRFNEPMDEHTSIRIGGPADAFVIPVDVAEMVAVAGACIENSVPFFTLGDGSNILVSDRGISGVVMHVSQLNSIQICGETVSAACGAPVDRVVVRAREHGLTGLESFHTMPGSIGGAVYMNARCYGKSMSEVLKNVAYLDENLRRRTYVANLRDFGYKVSPFQRIRSVIVRADFRLSRGVAAHMDAKMCEVKADRERKGHFAWPSAGSAFKNDRSFGMPTGKVVDSLGLKGYRVGGAKISDLHGNIVVNAGGATAEDVDRLLRFVERAVSEAYGFTLQREIISVGR